MTGGKYGNREPRSSGHGHKAQRGDKVKIREPEGDQRGSRVTRGRGDGTRRRRNPRHATVTRSGREGADGATNDGVESLGGGGEKTRSDRRIAPQTLANHHQGEDEGDGGGRV